MILINLLPHREIARKKRKEAFQMVMGACLVLGLVLAAGVYGWFQMHIGSQQDRNAFLKAEISKLDAQIKEIDGLEREIRALRERQTAVEDLQADRNVPVHMLNELVTQLPEGVYLTSIQQNGQDVEMRGSAQSNERVSEVLRNLSARSQWFANPKLKEIVAGTVALTPKDNRKIVNFSLTFRLLKASEAAALAEQQKQQQGSSV